MDQRFSLLQGDLLANSIFSLGEMRGRGVPTEDAQPHQAFSSLLSSVPVESSSTVFLPVCAQHTGLRLILPSGAPGKQVCSAEPNNSCVLVLRGNGELRASEAALWPQIPAQGSSHLAAHSLHAEHSISQNL